MKQLVPVALTGLEQLDGSQGQDKRQMPHSLTQHRAGSKLLARFDLHDLSSAQNWHDLSRTPEVSASWPLGQTSFPLLCLQITWPRRSDSNQKIYLGCQMYRIQDYSPNNGKTEVCVPFSLVELLYQSQLQSAPHQWSLRFQLCWWR